MEISKSISYITEDPRWQQKLLIGTGVLIASSVLSVILIGFLGYIIFAGYLVRLLQNVRDGQTYPMPEWDQWGEDLTRGFKLVIAIIVWILPLLILAIPTSIGGAMASDNNDASQFIGTMILLCGGCLNIIYGLLLALVLPGISVAFAKDEQLTSGLQLRQIIDLDTRQHRPSACGHPCRHRRQHRPQPHRFNRGYFALRCGAHRHLAVGNLAHRTLTISPLWTDGLCLSLSQWQQWR